MISNKNKVIITVLAILGAIVLMVVMFNKMNMGKKVEKFVDDEVDGDDMDNVEAYEDVDANAKVDAEEEFAEGDEDTEEEEPKPKKKVEKKDDKKDDKKDEKKVESNVATKLKQFIDTIDKEINSKDLSEEVKNKVVKDLMSNITALHDMGVSASKVVTDTINKYAPPKNTYVDAPIVTKSMDSIKGHLRAALNELEAMSGKETFNERFTPSRPSPTPMKKVEPMTNEETTSSSKGTTGVEGFENAPLYALY